MKCGHSCEKLCHDGPCFCDKETLIKCPCESITLNIKCLEIDQYTEFNCKDVCTTMYSCGKHKCTRICCQLKPYGSKAFNLTLGISHICNELCTNLHECGHECGDMCHTGECQPCNKLISRERLLCACGQSMIEPPIKCGMQPPVCLIKCNKKMLCGHLCPKYCHFGPCTNCSVLVESNCICGKNKIMVKC